MGVLKISKNFEKTYISKIFLLLNKLPASFSINFLKYSYTAGKKRAVLTVYINILQMKLPRLSTMLKTEFLIPLQKIQEKQIFNKFLTKN